MKMDDAKRGDAPYFPSPRAREGSYREAPYRDADAEARAVAPSNVDARESEGGGPRTVVARPDPPASRRGVRASDALTLEQRMARDAARSNELASELVTRIMTRIGLGLLGFGVIYGAAFVAHVAPRAHWFTVSFAVLMVAGGVWLLVWRIRRLVSLVKRIFRA
jgi:hypothetical protein